LELGAARVDDADGLDGLNLGRRLLGAGSGVARAGGDVSADVLDSIGGFFKRLLGGRVDGGDSLLDLETIVGKAAGDVKELTGDDVSDSAEDGEGDDTCYRDSEYTRHAACFQAADGRSQQKGEREGEGEGDQKLSGEVEDQDGDREHEKRANPGKLGASSVGHTTSRRLTNRAARPGKNTSWRSMQGAGEIKEYRV
jgi:hypothetical protein